MKPLIMVMAIGFGLLILYSVYTFVYPSMEVQHQREIDNAKHEFDNAVSQWQRHGRLEDLSAACINAKAAVTLMDKYHMQQDTPRYEQAAEKICAIQLH